ncbi:MAG: phosphoribosylformylglycinamidine synthase, partial [Lachnospiraceae bacterium]|nr:phosphoribosylformylglycinamidine synthase [Lachnospiraceae bacterium]
MVRRIYVEKKDAFAIKGAQLQEEIASYLGIKGITKVRELIRYDVENISDEVFERACGCVFSEPPVDMLYREDFERNPDDKIFSVEYLPGQFDLRADSAMQCVRFLNENEDPLIKTATTYCLSGTISDDEFEKIKSYCINPVDSRETSLIKPDTLLQDFKEPDDVAVFTGFTTMDDTAFRSLYDSLGLAMTYKDFLHIRNYFATEEKRDPSMTEIRVLDTYWSDHCRHTTFSTELKNVTFEDGLYSGPIKASYEKYLQTHQEVFKGRDDKFVCLMDLALMAMRKLKKEGKLNDQEESDEINACSIVVPVTIDGKEEEWLISFKNETHNHPTEIEPFGGAATCLGGAIRDPLSGRSYVYQAMRVTGAADPTKALSETLKGKLPQKKLVKGAASGYSSYGNQIGLATGYVKEIYHPDYVAKRMEIGAVMGAAPRKNVIRETSDPGDVILLLGGRTGRDGCGGATGSSKVHTEASIETCGAEVQKGNAPTERKLQRLFRRPEVSKLIRKCNDFGAGGVSVAIGELADGLIIDLDKVPKKYAGLDGTELAISESQERMAVVLDPADVKQFLAYAGEENLEAVEVATVTKEPRLVMKWRGKTIVDLSRAFLNTNGAHQECDVVVEMPDEKKPFFASDKVEKVSDALQKGDVKAAWLASVSDLNACSQKGLVEMFDSSIGAASTLMPYGGKYQLSETQTMIAKLPVLHGKCDAVTMMSYGFDPYLSSWSPYHGAVYAVLESVSRIVSSGGDPEKIRFTFQEYFRRMTEDLTRWSQPFAALLGAFEAQIRFGLPSIGGKDSMSGSFNEIDVPPTLVSFAVDVAKEQEVITPELKESGNVLVLMRLKKDSFDLPDYEENMECFKKFHQDAKNRLFASAYTLDAGGLAPALSKMAFGNALGIKIADDFDAKELFAPYLGAIVAEVAPENIGRLTIPYEKIGTVTDDGNISGAGFCLPLSEVLSAWKAPLEKVFPSTTGTQPKEVESKLYRAEQIYVCKNKVAKPTVFIPVFPGTNCEYDSMKAFEKAGADVICRVFTNRSAQDIRDSVAAYADDMNRSQIIMFPGGFSAGDEPDGSAKFFATAYRNAAIREAVEKLLDRDGLVLGICNGFQALVKLGLIPYGKITDQ